MSTRAPYTPAGSYPLPDALRRLEEAKRLPPSRESKDSRGNFAGVIAHDGGIHQFADMLDFSGGELQLETPRIIDIRRRQPEMPHFPP